MTDTQIDDAERARHKENVQHAHEALWQQAGRAITAHKELFDTHRATIEQNKYPYKMPTNFERWIKCSK